MPAAESRARIFVCGHRSRRPRGRVPPSYRHRLRPPRVQATGCTCGSGDLRRSRRAGPTSRRAARGSTCRRHRSDAGVAGFPVSDRARPSRAGTNRAGEARSGSPAIQQEPAAPQACRSAITSSPTRLSYFLWASMPDAELRRLADRGELRDGRPCSTRRCGACCSDDEGASAGGGVRRPVAADPRARVGGARQGAVPRLRRLPAPVDAARDRAVLRQHHPRRPQHPRVPRCAVHVRERAAGAALRHRRRDGPEFRRVESTGRSAAAY